MADVAAIADQRLAPVPVRPIGALVGLSPIAAVALFAQNTGGLANGTWVFDGHGVVP